MGNVLEDDSTVREFFSSWKVVYENKIDNNRNIVKILGKNVSEPPAGTEPTTFQLLVWML